MRYKALSALAVSLIAIGLALPAYSGDIPGDGPTSRLPSYTDSQAAKSVFTFRIDTHPDLDSYQPCDGGDNILEFPINITGLNPATASAAKLTLAVWDVDYACSGSCCERDTVYINGHQILTPQPFLTGANGQWSTVSFNVPIEWLVEGDNTVRIIIDAGGCDSWCVECDWAELSLTVGPEIEDIEVLNKVPGTATYTTLVDPETNKQFYLHAKMKNMTGYELIKVTWSGSIPSGTGEYFPVKFMPGQHGKKTVTAKAVYRKTGETTVQTTDPKTEELKVFFSKNGDYNRDNIPNWYEYWKRDGAVPALTAFEYTFDPGLYGMFDPGPYKLYVGSGAGATHYPSGWTIGGITFGGPGVTGIDCAAEVCAHENFHKWVYDEFTSALFYPLIPLDTDRDGLPDEYETNTSGTLIANPDTHNVAGIRGFPDYATYGDQEWMCMKAGHGVKGVALKDWAKPGKQTVVKGIRAPKGPQPRMSPVMLWSGSPNGTGFNGTYTDNGVDTDSNGLFDFLQVNAGITVAADGIYSITGQLKDNMGKLVALYEDTVSLPAGAGVLPLSFSGLDIHLSRIPGPYLLSAAVATQDGEPISSVGDAYATKSYTISQFEGHQAYFGPTITDARVDTNANLMYDALEFTVSTVCTVTGAYQVNAYLTDSDLNPICTLSATANLTPGDGTVKLLASGQSIRQHKKNGPYKVMFLEILDGEKQTDFIYDAYTTAAYPFEEFEPGFAEFGPISAWTDAGVDTNSNTFYDLLRVTMPVTVFEAGQYALSARLYDENDTFITEAYSELNLPTGSQTLNADFSGSSIFGMGLPGPYRMKFAFLYDPGSEVTDSIPGYYQTAPYAYTQFEPPTAIALTRQFDDRAVDTNSDGIPEYLDVDIGVVAVQSGYYALNARLADKFGGEITWASTQESLTAGTRKMMTLRYSASVIQAHNVDGPYHVQDIYIYNTSNTALSDTYPGPYVTKTAWTSADSVPPVITITPESGNYFIDGVNHLSLNATITDAASGVKESAAKLNGSPVSLPVPVSAPGNFELQVSAVDNAGNIAGLTADYTAFYVDWFEPLTRDTTIPFKTGAIVPLKFSVLSGSGQFVNWLNPTVSIIGPAPLKTVVATIPAQLSSQKRFRMAPLPCYQALIRTAGWKTGTYTATLGSSYVKNTLSIPFSVRNVRLR